VDCLLVSAGTWRCALPLAGVVETLRALPLHPCSSVPAYVRGVSIIRGVATPILDLAAFLGAETAALPERLVVMRSGARPLALAVDHVFGIRSLDEETARPLRGVLTPFARGQVRSLRALDGELVALFEDAIVLPDELSNAALALGGSGP
jgi:purine-binding chemotaxis protein CheW